MWGKKRGGGELEESSCSQPSSIENYKSDSQIDYSGYVTLLFLCRARPLVKIVSNPEMNFKNFGTIRK